LNQKDWLYYWKTHKFVTAKKVSEHFLISRSTARLEILKMYKSGKANKHRCKHEGSIAYYLNEKEKQ
jgi:hypothetical protein